MKSTRNVKLEKENGGANLIPTLKTVPKTLFLLDTKFNL